MTKEDNAGAPTLSEMADRGRISHLHAAFHPVNAQYDFAIGTLPYPPSNGPWLERLCFLLLRTQGYVPRYFGNVGQKDRGVDLLVTTGDQLFVYQCKNVQSFSSSDMLKALKDFEDEWLKSSGLPKPNKFILCCPSLLRERVANEKWTKLERDFRSRTGVEVEYWHRNYLDETLKFMPDIVAEVFSDQIAKLFCERDDWNYDQFAPVAADSPDRYIKRYQERKSTDRIYLDPDLAAQFTEKMERNGSILIMGLPGSGKTTTSFALTDTLQNWRTYYVTLRENISDNDFVNAVESRLARQTIFLVDDCQGRFKQLNEVMNRISRLLHGRRSQALFVFLARTTPTPDLLIRGEERTDFEEELKDADAILRFTADQQTFRRIVERTRPDFGSLSDERLASLYEFTGHDLFLLDEMLQTIDDERGIDDLNLEFLFVTTLARYFGKGTVHRPGFMKLAALAQFEIAPRVGDFPIDLEREDAKAVAELVVQAGSPPRYFFLHSSAAELIFRALTRNEEIDHAGKAADYLIEYFKDRPANDQALSADLSKAIWNRLKLAEEPEEYRLKSAFLEDIYSLMERSFETLPLNLMAVCLIILRRSGSAAFERYQELTRLNAEEGTVLESAISGSFWDSSLFLRLVKKTDARLLTILRNQVSARGLLWVAQATEFQNFLLLVSAVSDAEDSTLRGSLSTIPDNQIEAMIQRTMDNRRSIGTLHSALWELKEADERLLTLLEEKIGVTRWLRLITANGSIFELFMLIKSSSLPMAERLIVALDNKVLDQLIEQTILLGRSIGTLSLALRELKQTDERLLTLLEEKIGVTRWLRLIAANGSIFELFQVIQSSSLPMAERLIVVLDDTVLDQLIEQTISSGRSIGTLDFALRELKQTDKHLLARLEEKIGVTRWLRLIAANGSILELFKVIQRSSLPMAEKLIVGLDDMVLDQLVERTILSDRSIGSLHWTLRYLKAANHIMLRQLEEKIGTVRWWRLVCSFGSIGILVDLLPAMDKSFRQRFISAAWRLSVENWQKLMLRGGFYELCRFVTGVPEFFSAKSQLDSVKPILVTSIQISNWKARDTGWRLLSAAEDSVARNYLLQLFYEEVGDIEPSALVFSTFAEVAHCVNLLCRLTPVMRKESLDVFFRFVDEGKPIYSDPEYLRSVRSLFSTLATPQVERESAHKLLNVADASAVAPVCSKATTLDLFLYLWNLYLLWFEWESAEGKSFVDFLNAEIREAVIASLGKRFSTAKQDQEARSLIMLTGLLSFLAVRFDRPNATKDFVSRLGSFDKMIDDLDEDQTFIPSVFYLLGLEWLYQKDREVPAVVWWDELGKVHDYTQRTAALDYLQSIVRKRSRLL